MTSLELHVPETAHRGVVTIGNFDGVHRGHQAMLSAVQACATELNCPAVVVTFDPHPVTVLRPDVKLPRLSTIAERTRLLKQHGADEVIVLPVCRQLLDMTPAQFFREIVVAQLRPAGMVEGPDFRFGKDRAGDTKTLREFCEAEAIKLTVIDPVCNAETMISSTQIRKLLAAGDVAAANELLGHTYSIAGCVRRGAGRGRTLGFPTANLEDIENLLPANGVYAARCDIDSRRYPVAMSIGPNPTFDDHTRKVECHIVDYSGDLYDNMFSLSLVAQIRELVAFENVDALKRQINTDVATCVAAINLLDDTNIR